MKKPRKFMLLAIILCVIVTLVGFGGIMSSAFADSESLVIENAKGESKTVGSVSVVNTGSSLKININTDDEFPLFFTLVTFRGNTGGVAHIDSTARTEFLTHKSDTHHSFSVPLSEIKEDDIEIAIAVDVVVDRKVKTIRKAFAVAFVEVPKATTTTEKKEVTTTTEKEREREKEREVATTTTVAAVTSTTAAVVTTETVAPVTTSTTVLPATTTTILPVVTTVAPRAALPITGTDYNWYLIGGVLVLLGAAIYLGSAQKSS